jgi:hypothetical protein
MEEIEDIKLSEIEGEIKISVMMGFSYSLGEFDGWIKPGFGIECTIPKTENPDEFVKKLKAYAIKNLKQQEKILTRMVGAGTGKG